MGTTDARQSVTRSMTQVDDGSVASIRLRLAPADARYTGGLVAGSTGVEIFADLETELSLLEGGDEGLCAGYDSVESLAPLRVGDFIEATARVVARGRSSRLVEAEIRRVISVDARGARVPGDKPVPAARATATIVVGKTATAPA